MIIESLLRGLDCTWTSRWGKWSFTSVASRYDDDEYDDDDDGDDDGDDDHDNDDDNDIDDDDDNDDNGIMNIDEWWCL